jgi:hypothetical protein
LFQDESSWAEPVLKQNHIATARSPLRSALRKKAKRQGISKSPVTMTIEIPFHQDQKNHDDEGDNENPGW